MRATAQLQIAIALGAITACTTTPAAKDVPAVIVRPDAQSRADLQSAVSKALNRTSVTLADDALTQDSSLIIEPVRLRDPQEGIAQGGRKGARRACRNTFAWSKADIAVSSYMSAQGSEWNWRIRSARRSDEPLTGCRTRGARPLFHHPAKPARRRARPSPRAASGWPDPGGSAGASAAALRSWACRSAARAP